MHSYTSQVVANYLGATDEFKLVRGKPITWPGGAPPADMPRCGYRGDAAVCEETEADGSNVFILVVVLVALVLLVVVGGVVSGVLVYRKVSFLKKIEHSFTLRLM